MKLYRCRRVRRPNLPLSLQISDRINERGVRPRFRDTLRLLQRDNVRSRLFDNAETIQLQLTEYHSFPRAGRPSQYKPFHSVPHSLALSASMEC
jgi:hypothetical protein